MCHGGNVLAQRTRHVCEALRRHERLLDLSHINDQLLEHAAVVARDRARARARVGAWRQPARQVPACTQVHVDVRRVRTDGGGVHGDCMLLMLAISTTCVDIGVDIAVGIGAFVQGVGRRRHHMPLARGCNAACHALKLCCNL